MPRRNYRIIAFTFLLSLLCHQRAINSEQGRYFSEVLNLIERRALEPMGRQDLYETAVSAMVAELDPYSAYVNRVDRPHMHEDIDQKFGGIGIQFRIEKKEDGLHLIVFSPLIDSPAYKKGIRAKDEIVAVDGQSTRTFSSEDVVRRLRGIEGEVVTLTVKRLGISELFDVKLQRAVIKVDSVQGELRNEDGSWNFQLAADSRVGYIRLKQFGENSVDELRAALDTLEKSNAQAFILDLRGNSGGLLTAAVDICNLFMKEGVIVTTRGRNAKVLSQFDALPEKSFSDKATTLPMVVLVNHLSASASEIVAACLQDHKRAIIIGQRTWGKGTVQNVIPIEGGRADLRLTTAGYWRPSGINIHRGRDDTPEDTWGVVPDKGFSIPLNEQQTELLVTFLGERDVVDLDGKPIDRKQRAQEELRDDPQLRSAVEYLQGKLHSRR